MFKNEKELYEFGDFRLDVTEHFLARSDGEKRIPLSEKAFETLCILVRNGGHLVSKKDLLDQVWADSFVEENNLDKCIHAIRRALGEKPGEPKFIETVRKHGYRFVAEVRRVREASDAGARGRGDTAQTKQLKEESAKEPNAFAASPRPRVATSQSGAVVAIADWRHEEVENETAEENAAVAYVQNSAKPAAEIKLAPTVPLSENKRRIVSRKSFVALALVALFIGAIALGFYLFSSNKTNAGNKKSIAVLPLKPINAGNRNELYENGIADELILRLNSMKGFLVRPLSATRKYADIEQDPLAAGKEQQVDYVLASNYQLADGKIKITAQFFNVATGQIEETFKSEKDAGSLFAMQDAIANEFGNILQTRFVTTSSSPAAKRGTNNEEAYRLYLQGMFLADGRNEADAKKAVEIFEQAVRLDPNYAQAWAGKAYSHRGASNFGRNVNTHEEYQKTIEAINRALALDANSSLAYAALCENKMYYEYDFDGAERACRRAVELNPDSAPAHQVYNRFLNSRGRFDEAIAEIKTAIDLEPASLYNQRLLGNSLQYARRYDEAVAQFKRVAEMDKNFYTNYMWLSQTLALQGKEAEAFEVWMKFLEFQKANEETIAAFQNAYQASGWQGVVRLRAERFEKSSEIYFHGAAYNAMIGNRDKAFEYLEKSYERREWGPAYLQVDPRFDNLRDDSRFDELVGRVGLK